MCNLYLSRYMPSCSCWFFPAWHHIPKFLPLHKAMRWRAIRVELSPSFEKQKQGRECNAGNPRFPQVLKSVYTSRNFVPEYPRKVLSSGRGSPISLPPQRKKAKQNKYANAKEIKHYLTHHIRGSPKRRWGASRSDSMGNCKWSIPQILYVNCKRR